MCKAQVLALHVNTEKIIPVNKVVSVTQQVIIFPLLQNIKNFICRNKKPLLPFKCDKEKYKHTEVLNPYFVRIRVLALLPMQIIILEFVCGSYMPPIILKHKPIQQVIWISCVAKKSCPITTGSEMAGIIKDCESMYEGTHSQD